MTQTVVVAYPQIAYSRREAAAATGLSVSRLDEAVRDDLLTVHYEGTKPLFLAVDLEAYVRSLATEKPQRRSSA